MQKNHRVLSQLLAVLLKLSWIHVALYAVWSSISSNIYLIPFQRFKSGDFVFMQDSAAYSAHRAKATQDDLRNVVPDFAVEKTSGSTVQLSKNRMGTN